MFQNKGIKYGKLVSLSPKECAELCSQGAILVDVREEYLNGFKMFDVEKVIYLPKSRFRENLSRLPKDKPLILADSSGIKSKEFGLLLIDNRYHEIAILAGGIVEWERDNAPLIIDTGQRLTGSCMCQLKPRERKNRRKNSEI